jgi:hypothetical protein
MEEVDAIKKLFDDICIETFLDANIGKSSTSQDPTTNDHKQTISFYQLWDDDLRKLYPSCEKFIQIIFVLKMIHIKAFCNMDNKVFDMMINW